VLHAARWKYRTQKKSPSAHHRTTLFGYIFANKARIDNWKNVLNSNTPTCPYNMVNSGLLTAEICWRVWGTPANFNGFRVLAALLHGTLVVSVSQTLMPLDRGRHLYSAGRPSRWALAHILVLSFFLLWSPYVIGRPYIFSCCFFFFFLLFFSSPNLRRRRLDVYHTLAHGVDLVRI